MVSILLHSVFKSFSWLHASLSRFNSGGIFRVFMTDSGGQIIGVTRAFILIFSFSVDSKRETVSYVFLVL